MEIEDKILTITKVNFGSKWAEFWFEEEKEFKDILDDNFEPTGEKEERYSMSCKNYMIWGAVDNADILNSIYNHGFVGRKLKWAYKFPNWELVGFVL